MHIDRRPPMDATELFTGVPGVVRAETDPPLERGSVRERIADIAGFVGQALRSARSFVSDRSVEARARDVDYGFPIGPQATLTDEEIARLMRDEV